MKTNIDRRTFLTTAVTGLFPSWLIQEDKPPLDARFNYDISAYSHTDPALLHYAETSHFPTGFREPKCLAVTGSSILVGGDRALKMYDTDGQLQTTLELPALPHAVAGLGVGRLAVAFQDHIQLFGPAPTVGESLGSRAHLTGITQLGDRLFLADAGNREVVQCDLTGKVLSRIKGFVVPSPYFDIRAGADGLLWVANPGKHRLEGYTPAGHLELSWGETGMDIANFCGCCNPVYFTRMPDGRFVTSEKGLNRIKIYTATGKFSGVVAGVEHLVKDLELAKQACANCHIGFGFPIACDAANRILALDPATRNVRIFTPKAA